MQEYGIITTLPYSKDSSPIFAQRKPKGKLRILVDLRRINHLLKNDYNKHNHPVTTIADAAQHMAGKKYFCKLDCSQAYHCLQMADEQSIQLLAFNFGSRTFAYLRLAQGLNRSLSAFNSTIREYLDSLVKADKCAQYVDDIGIAANNVDELIINIEAVFQQIQKAGLKLSMSKCAFGHPKIDFLGRSITTEGIAPLEDKIDKFLNNLKLPTSVKSLHCNATSDLSSSTGNTYRCWQKNSYLCTSYYRKTSSSPWHRFTRTRSSTSIRTWHELLSCPSDCHCQTNS